MQLFTSSALLILLFLFKNRTKNIFFVLVLIALKIRNDVYKILVKDYSLIIVITKEKKS